MEVAGEREDPDGDGVFDEVSVVDMSALQVFNATSTVPFVEPFGAAGMQGFTHLLDAGCAACRVTVLRRKPGSCR